MTADDKTVAVALVLGFVVSCVGLTLALGTGWGLLWAGILLMTGALFLDARGDG